MLDKYNKKYKEFINSGKGFHTLTEQEKEKYLELRTASYLRFRIDRLVVGVFFFMAFLWVILFNELFNELDFLNGVLAGVLLGFGCLFGMIFLVTEAKPRLIEESLKSEYKVLEK